MHWRVPEFSLFSMPNDFVSIFQQLIYVSKIDGVRMVFCAMLYSDYVIVSSLWVWLSYIYFHQHRSNRMGAAMSLKDAKRAIVDAI